jgi:hypothetical protein
VFWAQNETAIAAEADAEPHVIGTPGIPEKLIGLGWAPRSEW